MEHATSASVISGGASISSDSDRIAWKMSESQEGKGTRRATQSNASHELRHHFLYGGLQDAGKDGNVNGRRQQNIPCEPNRSVT